MNFKEIFENTKEEIIQKELIKLGLLNSVIIIKF